MTAQLIGLDDVEHILETVAPRHARNLARAFVHGLAGEARNEARRRAPRRSGDLRKAIKAKRLRPRRPTQVASAVIVETAGAQRDAFYWRFQEYGTREHAEQPFIRPTRDMIQARLPTLVDKQFKKKLSAAVAREQRRRAKR